MTINTAVRLQAPSRRTLRQDQLACASCGIAVDGPFAAEDVQSVIIGTERVAEAGVEAKYHRVRSVTVEFARCERCRERRALAEQLVRQYPRTARAQGSDAVAVERLDSVLSVGELLGAPIHIGGELTGNVAKIGDEQQLQALLLRMLPAEGDAFSAAGLPYIRAAASTEQQGIANVAPFGHVPPEMRSALRDGFASWLRSRVVQQPRRYRPPRDDERCVDGCLYCGAGTVLATPDEAPWAWHGPFDVQPSRVGGSLSRNVRGYLCATCDAARNAAGGTIGETTVRAALLSHFGVAPYDGVDELVVPAWGATGRTTPNDAPWTHIDPASLRQARVTT